MKFSTGIVTLLAISSSCAFRIIKREEQAAADDYSYLGTNPIFPVKEECTTALEKLSKDNSECNLSSQLVSQDNITESALQDICAKYNSEKCQKYYSTSYTDVAECKDSLKVSLLGMDNLRKTTNLLYQTECATDENNKFCPLNSLELMHGNEAEKMSEEEQLKLLTQTEEETCKSKKCTDSFVNYFEELEKVANSYTESLSKEGNLTDKEIEELKKETGSIIDDDTKKIIEYLKSEKCTSQHANATSGAESVLKNINVYLVLSLISTLYFLL